MRRTKYEKRQQFLSKVKAKQNSPYYYSNYLFLYEEPIYYEECYWKEYDMYCYSRYYGGNPKIIRGYFSRSKVYYKKISNKKVRNTSNIGNRGNYKRCYDLKWEID